MILDLVACWPGGQVCAKLMVRGVLQEIEEQRKKQEEARKHHQELLQTARGMHAASCPRSIPVWKA